MTTIACIVVFLWIKSHLFEKKNSSHTKNQLNGYNITGDINGRPVHTTRIRTGKKALHAMLFCVRAVYVRVLVHTTRTYGPLKRPVRKKNARTYGPYVRAVRTDRPYGPYVRVVCTGLYS